MSDDGWYPIATGPHDGTLVLLGWQGSSRINIGWYGCKNSRRGVNHGDAWGAGTDFLRDRFNPQPTHWRQLPDPPTPNPGDDR